MVCPGALPRPRDARVTGRLISGWGACLVGCMQVVELKSAVPMFWSARKCTDDIETRSE